MSITSEKKKELIKKYGGNETNTGSMEAQVALLTARIKHITGHLKKYKKDHGTLRSLNNLVSRRKRFLKYLAKNDINNYRTLIKHLGLRK